MESKRFSYLNEVSDNYKTSFRENRITLFLIYIYKILVVIPFCVLSTALFGSLAALFAILVNEQTGNFFGIMWAKFNSFVTMMKVEVKGSENIDKNQSYVIAANHQSLYDIYVIYGWLPIPFKWVMKIQLREVPFLGYACYKLGHVFIDRSNREKALKSIEEAKSRIQNGSSIFFFPEGTRSMSGELQDFKKGAFKTALDFDLPILPVSIINTYNILPTGTINLTPGTAKIVVHKPIEIDNYNDDNIEELMERTRGIIHKGIEVNE